jgi:hypothetical protein
MLNVIGIAVMVVGVALVVGARLYLVGRLRLERWGGNIFLAGLVTWALHYAL